MEIWMMLMIGIVGGGILFAILWLLCRTFMTRSVIVILGACAWIASLLAPSVITTIYPWTKTFLFVCEIAFPLSCFITYFFCFGKWFGKKTGNVSQPTYKNISSSGYEEHTEKETYTTYIFFGSAVLTAVTYILVTELEALIVGILIPIVIIFVKILLIRKHFKERKSAIDVNKDDRDPTTEVKKVRF